MSKNFIDHQFKFLSGNIDWMSLSWEARGMAVTLMALGDIELHMGTIPKEDELWRSVLGIPSQHVIQAALKRSVNGRGMREQRELDVAWTEVWKEELLRWFIEIDEEFLKNRPQYAAHKGRFWYPLLDDINEEQKAQVPAKKKPKQTASGVKGLAKKSRGAKTTATPVSDWDFPNIRYTSNVFKSCWDVPLNSETRTSLWNNAMGVLAPGADTGGQASARQFLGKLIKEFGEQNVASAVAQLMVRPVKPADPKSFLHKQLKNSAEGSPAVQRARAQRVKVPL